MGRDATQAHADRRERLRMGARAPAILGRVSRGVFSHSVRRSLTARVFVTPMIEI